MENNLTHAKQVATTIISQMGGLNKLRAMINIDRLSFDMDAENQVYIDFKFSGSNKFNLCQVKLTNDDLYTMKFLKVTPSKGLISIEVTKDLYFDQIQKEFTNQTRLDLSID